MQLYLTHMNEKYKINNLYLRLKLNKLENPLSPIPQAKLVISFSLKL